MTEISELCFLHREPPPSEGIFVYSDENFKVPFMVQAAGALTPGARRVRAFVHNAQFSYNNLVRYYHLTFSQNFGKI